MFFNQEPENLEIEFDEIHADDTQILPQPLSFDPIILIDTIDQIEELEQVAILVQLVSPMYLHPMLW